MTILRSKGKSYHEIKTNLQLSKRIGIVDAAPQLKKRSVSCGSAIDDIEYLNTAQRKTGQMKESST